MKRLFQATAVGLLAFAAPAHALFYIAGQEVMLNTSATLEYDSNVFSNALEESDFIARGVVGLSYQRPYRFFDIGGGINLTGVKYNDFSDRDRLDWGFNFFLTPSVEFGTRFWTLDTDIGFERRTRSDEDLGDLVTTDNYRGGATLTITPTPKYFIEGGFLYRITKPRDIDRTDRRTFSVNASAGYALGPRYFVFGQVARDKTTTKEANPIENVTWNYSVGLRGTFTPRLSGSASVGVSRREIDATGETNSTPTYSVGLNYVIDRQTSASLSGSRSFTTSLADSTQTTTQATVALNRTLRPDLTGSLSLTYSERKFDQFDFARKDRTYTGRATLRYAMGVRTTLSGGIEHTIQDSDAAFFDHSRTRLFVTLSASF